MVCAGGLCICQEATTRGNKGPLHAQQAPPSEKYLFHRNINMATEIVRLPGVVGCYIASIRFAAFSVNVIINDIQQYCSQARTVNYKWRSEVPTGDSDIRDFSYFNFYGRRKIDRRNPERDVAAMITSQLIFDFLRADELRQYPLQFG